MAVVIDFNKKKAALFTEQQKTRMAASIQDLTPHSEQAVDRIEQNLCTQLAENVRETATTVAEAVALKLAKLIFG